MQFLYPVNTIALLAAAKSSAQEEYCYLPIPNSNFATNLSFWAVIDGLASWEAGNAPQTVDGSYRGIAVMNVNWGVGLPDLSYTSLSSLSRGPTIATTSWWLKFDPYTSTSTLASCRIYAYDFWNMYRDTTPDPNTPYEWTEYTLAGWTLPYITVGGLTLQIGYAGVVKAYSGPVSYNLGAPAFPEGAVIHVVGLPPAVSSTILPTTA